MYIGIAKVIFLILLIYKEKKEMFQSHNMHCI